MAALARSPGRGTAAAPPALQATLRLAQLILEGGDALRHRVDGLGAHQVRDPLELVEARVDQRVGAFAGDRLDAPHARADAALADDHEVADLPARTTVGSTAQLMAVAVDLDGAHPLAVLLVEEGVGPGIDRLLHRHPADDDGAVLADDAPDLGFDRAFLRVGQRPVEREVEAQILGRDARAGLARLLADHVAERTVQHVRARVVAHRVGAPVGIHDGGHGLADAEAAVERSAMDDEAARRFLGVGDVEQDRARALLADLALVADLAAALRVERGAVEDDLGLAGAGQLGVLDAVAQDRDDPALGRRGVVAEELRVAGASDERLVDRRALGVSGQLGLLAAAAALPLLGERLVEPEAVDPDAVLGGQLDRQVDRKAVGVVQPERDPAVEGRRRPSGRPPGDARSRARAS